MAAQIIDFYSARMQRFARDVAQLRRTADLAFLERHAPGGADTGPVRLVWQINAPRHWQLVDVDNPATVWARVEPCGDGKRRGRGMFAQPTVKALCLRPDLPSRHGGQHWSLASTVAMAKRDIVGYISRHRNAPEFELVQ